MATQAAPIPAPPVTVDIAGDLAMLGIPEGSYDLVPQNRVGKLIARRLTEAARDIPHFPLTVSVAMQPLLDARAAFNKTAEAKVSVNDYLLLAAARALVAVPAVNASLTPHGIAHHRHADIAMAVAIDGGLVTPILRGVEARGLADISAAARDLVDRAKRKRLQPDEYNGGTFCVSNLGMFGVTSFGSILNPPQAAILSVGAVEERVVPVDGQAGIANMMTVTLTCDHRVIDGATGARWLQAFRAAVADAATFA